MAQEDDSRSGAGAAGQGEGLVPEGPEGLDPEAPEDEDPAEGAAPDVVQAPLPVTGDVQAPLPATSRRHRDFTQSIPSARERTTSLAIGGACAALAVILLVWVVFMATGQGAGGSSTDDHQALVASSSAASSSVAADTPEPAPTTASLAMIGDVVLHPSVYSSGQRSDGSFDFAHLFAHVGNALSGSDLALVSQETLLGGADFGYHYQPGFNGPQEVGDAEVAAGFNVVLKASDHSLDEGYDGLHAELQFWESEHPEVTVLGVRDVESADPGSFDDVYVYEKDGLRIAVLDYTTSNNPYGSWYDQDSEGAVDTYDEGLLTRNVQEAKRQADLVVVCLHWGTDGSTTPSDDQREVAQLCCDLGVDVVLGAGPHVLQPVEVLEGTDGHQTVCYYSLGSYISGFYGDAYLVGGIAQLTFEKASDGTARVTGYGLTPVVTHKGQGEDETVYLLSDYTDALAETNSAGLSVDSARQVAADALGSAYDETTSSLWVDLDQGTATSEGTASSSND